MQSLHLSRFLLLSFLLFELLHLSFQFPLLPFQVLFLLSLHRFGSLLLLVELCLFFSKLLDLPVFQTLTSFHCYFHFVLHLVPGFIFPGFHLWVLLSHSQVCLLLFLAHYFSFVLDLHLFLVLHLSDFIHKRLIPSLHLLLLLFLSNLRIDDILKDLIIQLHLLHGRASLEGFVRLGRD